MAARVYADRVGNKWNLQPVATGRQIHRRRHEMGTWKFDPYHTQVEFSAKNLGMMTVRGHFNNVAASGELHPDATERSQSDATIKVARIRTHNEQRDKAPLRSNVLNT